MFRGMLLGMLAVLGPALMLGTATAAPTAEKPIQLSLKAPPQATGQSVTLQLSVEGDEKGYLDLWIAGRIVTTWKLPFQQVPAEWRVEVASLPPEAISILALRFTPATAGPSREAQVTIYNPAPAKPGKLIALIVGVGDYPDFKAGGIVLPDLDYARRDARRVKEYLLAQKQSGLYSAIEVVHLTDKEATRERILKELERLIQVDLQGNDRVFFYFSGHGMHAGRKVDRANPRVAIMTRDSNPNQPLETGISNQTLLARFAQINGRKLVLLDCCHAGGFVLTGRNLPASLRRVLPPQGEGLVVLASCRLEQESLETHQDAQSLFTRVLLHALSSSTTDTNRDGALSAEEISQVVLGRVPVDGRAKSRLIEQQPEVYLYTLEKPRAWFSVPK